MAIHDDDKISMILAYLQQILDEDEFSEVQYILTSNDDDWAGNDPVATDAPGPLSGMPRRGATMEPSPSNVRRGAMDRLPPQLRQKIAEAVLKARNADADAFAEAFPTVARIRVV